MARKKKTTLPRLSILAYNRQELQRWVDATERLVSAAAALTGIVERLEALTARSEAARKANRTRAETRNHASKSAADRAAFEEAMPSSREDDEAMFAHEEPHP